LRHSKHCHRQGSLNHFEAAKLSALSFGHKQTCLAAGGKEILLPSENYILLSKVNNHLKQFEERRRLIW
jgi:hypothetical protein